jgi:glycosyltransferase involved in cell wall biosynthesis
MLAILTTHPIQYQVPLWQALAQDQRVPFEVWYLTNYGSQHHEDREFGKSFLWDIETLDGYPFRLLQTPEGATPYSFFNCSLREDLRHRLRASGVTALWVQGWQVLGYWQAIQSAHSLGIDVWLRAESNDLAPVPVWKKPLKRLQLGWLFSRISKFLYIGEANRRLYRRFGVPESNLYRAPYAVDNARFKSQAAALRSRRAELRQRWGISPDAFCVLFCGKLIPKKRPMDLVTAARLLLANNSLPSVHLLFAGSGVLGEEIRRNCCVKFDADSTLPDPRCGVGTPDSLPLASFAGFLNQSEISKAYVAADCLVLPSDTGETWGLVVNEALASGLPCLVSDACGCADDLAQPATIFSVGNVSQLASRLLELSRCEPTVISPPDFGDTIESVVEAYAGKSVPGSARLARSN